MYRLNDRKRLPLQPATVRLSFSLLLMLVLGLSGGVCTVKAQSTEELVTEADNKALNQQGPQVFKAMGASSLNQAQTNLLKEYARVNVLKMSMASNRDALPDIRTTLKRDIDLRAKDAAKVVLLPEIAKNCELLFDHPLEIKLNAVMLLSDLNQDSGNLAKNTPPLPYLGMVDPLLKVINDPTQHEALKVIAANGLERVCRDASPKVNVRTDIAEALVKQLKMPETSEWYGRVCVQTLARTDVIINSQRQPFVVQILAEILVDNKKGWRLRSDAAYALGRVPYDNYINFPLMLHEIARLNHEMSLAQQSNPGSPHWRYCFFRTYLTFKPENAKDTALLDRAGKASLSSYRNEIQSLYTVTLPIVNEVLSSLSVQKISQQQVDNLKSWVDANQPEKLTVSTDPSLNLKPLRTADAKP